MKKSKFLILAVFLAAVSVQGASGAEETSISGDYVYDLNGTRSAVILEYTGDGGDVVIPDLLDGYTVTEIASEAFPVSCEVLTVTIPDTVAYIGAGAFSAEILTDIFVNDASPYYCDLDGVLFTEDLCVLQQYPAGRKETVYTIPASVLSIENYAFRYAHSLTELEIPDSVQIVGDGAFFDCSSLERVRLGAGAYYLGVCPFYGENLNEIIVDDANEFYCSENGILFTRDMSEIVQYPAGKTEETCSIPDTVTAIAGGAFAGAVYLTQMDIPRNVSVIDDEAFYGCIGLKTVYFPRGLQYIGAYAFSGCENLTAAYFKGNALPQYMWGDGVFSGTPEGFVLYFPQGNNSGWKTPSWKAPDGTVYRTDTFSPAMWEYEICGDGTAAVITGWNGTSADVTVPQDIDGYTVVGIAGHTFEDITLIRTVVLPDTVVSIGDYAFAQCSRITSVVLPESLTEIGDSAFSGCVKLAGVEMPDSLEKIGDNAFYECKLLTEIRFHEGLLYIGTEAFRYCTGLVLLAMPDTVVSIGQAAFADCTALESAVLSAGLSEIPPQMFSDCTALRSAEIPEAVQCIGSQAFYNCGVMTELILSEGLEEIGGSAFRYCVGLTEVILPDSVKVIGSSAFSSCTGLMYAELPAGMTQIPDAMFWDCTALEEIELPETLLSVGSYAFSGTAIESITLPASVNDIGYQAFYGCAFLNRIRFLGDAPEAWGGQIASSDGMLLIVPVEAEGWSNPIWTAGDGEIYRTAPWGVNTLMGDVNGDGSTDTEDGQILSRYFAGYDVTAELKHLYEADTDLDGTLTRRDCMILARYLDGWKTVSLGKNE